MPKKGIGTKLKIGTDYVAGLTSIDPIEKSADTIETTTLDTPDGHRTYIGGLKDGGEVAISGNFEVGDDGQTAMDTAFESGDLTTFEVIFPASVSASWSFSGIVTRFRVGGATTDGLLTFEATIKISGKPSLTTTASSGLTALSLTGTGGTLSPTFANSNQSYTYSGVSASSVTVTATAASHTLKLYIDGVYSQDLTSGSASSAISLTLNVGKKLTIVAQEDGKAPVTYEVIVVKTS